MVTLAPLMGSARANVAKSSAPVAGSGRYTASTFAALNAALCMDGRHRMPDRAAGNAVDLGGVGNRAEVVVLKHRPCAQLADVLQRARIRPDRSETRGQHTSRHAVRPHPDDHEVVGPAGSGSEREQRQAVAEAGEPRGNLDDLGAGRVHGRHPRVEVDRHAVIVVRREHDSPAAGLRKEVVEARAPLEVDVLGALRQGIREDLLPLFLRPAEFAAFPRGAARDDRRPCPPRERAGDVGIADRIEPQLDEIRVLHGVAALAQFGRRGAGDGYAEQRFGHKKSLFNRRAEEARNLVALWRLRPRRMPLQSSPNTTARPTSTRVPQGGRYRPQDGTTSASEASDDSKPARRLSTQ